MRRKTKIVSILIIGVMAISSFYIATNWSFKFVRSQPEIAKGLQILQTPGLPHEAYEAAASNIMVYLFPGDYGFVAFPGQYPEIDDEYSKWETNILTTTNDLNQLIAGGFIAPEALDVALRLHDLLYATAQTIFNTIAVVPLTPLEPPKYDLKPVVLRELPIDRCPNWWWPKYHEPQVDEKEDTVFRGWSSFVVVQKFRGIKLFLAWWWWPTPPVDIPATVDWPYWVYGVVWLPVEYIKTIIVTPGRQPSVETIHQIEIDYEIADFEWFFAKDP